jgi:hypothetical protein
MNGDHNHPERYGIHESHGYMLNGKVVKVEIEAPDPAGGDTTAIVTATVKNVLDNKPALGDHKIKLAAFTDEPLTTLDAGLTWQNETKGVLDAQGGGEAEVTTDKYGVAQLELDWAGGPGARTAYVIAMGKAGSPCVCGLDPAEVNWTP